MVKAVAGNDIVKVSFARAGGLERVLSTMSRHLYDAAIVEMGCAAIGSVVLRQPEHSNIVMANQGADIIVKGMQIHKMVFGVQVCVNINNNMYFFYSAIPTASLLMVLYSIIIINKNLKLKKKIII